MTTRIGLSKALGPLLIALVPLTVPDRVEATEAAAKALSDNPMVEEDIDIIDFPGLLTEYANMVFLTVMPYEPNGNAGAVVGRDVALGVWVHREPRWRDLADLETLYNLPDPLPETYDLFDLFWGMSNGFGVRLCLGAGLETTDTPNSNGDPVSTGGVTLASDLQLGYSLDTRTYRGDFGAGATVTYFDLIESGEKTYSKDLTPSLSVRHRSILGPHEDVAWIVDFAGTRRAYTAHSVGQGDEQEGSMARWLATVVAGPRLRMPGEMTAWLGLRLTLEHLSGEIADQQQPTLSAMGFPGVVGSFEVRLWDLLFIRAGAEYEVYWSSVKRPKLNTDQEPDADKDIDSSRRGAGQRFNWSIGAGVWPGDFRIDATLTRMFLFNGPEVLGGGRPGFAGLISVAYDW